MVEVLEDSYCYITQTPFELVCDYCGKKFTTNVVVFVDKYYCSFSCRYPDIKENGQ